ncbi:MAG TPA: hypothetical protein VHM22_18575 [Bradyrhizobium sp.]|jgi:hypothetical protein|nr:hypothetical protein [Bradyrhizobium sp.]
MYIPGPAINLYNNPLFVARPKLFDESRIKRKPPKSTTADESKPGFLCWGVVGELPSAEAVPLVGFETHTEISRETTQIEIVNPDDPSQKVDALQTNKMTLEKTEPKEKNNSATTDADLTELSDAVRDAVKDTTSALKSGNYTVTFKPPERAL